MASSPLHWHWAHTEHVTPPPTPSHTHSPTLDPSPACPSLPISHPSTPLLHAPLAQVVISITLWNVGFATATGNVQFSALWSTTVVGGTRTYLVPVTDTFPINLAANARASFTATFKQPTIQATASLYYFLSWCVSLARSGVGVEVGGVCGGVCFPHPPYVGS